MYKDHYGFFLIPIYFGSVTSCKPLGSWSLLYIRFTIFEYCNGVCASCIVYQTPADICIVVWFCHVFICYDKNTSYLMQKYSLVAAKVGSLEQDKNVEINCKTTTRTPSVS